MSDNIFSDEDFDDYNDTDDVHYEKSPAERTGKKKRFRKW